MAKEPGFFIGTAGWSIRREHQSLFDPGASHLARTASQLSCTEINSSFYRPHKTATYAKWAASVPAHFRFAVKIPRTITHNARLVGIEDPLQRFLDECTALGSKLGPLLIQLPPSLKFDVDVAKAFFSELRERFGGSVALEPRHDSWFTSQSEKMLHKYKIARVAADPVPAKVSAQTAAEPGGDGSLVYYRLHGSPQIYYSDYSAAQLNALAKRLRAAHKSGAEVWCIFDNTALGHATQNALALTAMLKKRG
jgi:uncharacterized protein YecE (DUF72 family)